MPCTSVTEIVSPRSSSPNTSSPSSRPAQPVVSAAPTSVEHQAPTAAPAPVSSSSLRPRRSIRRPARYLWFFRCILCIELHVYHISYVLSLPTSGNRVKLLSLHYYLNVKILEITILLGSCGLCWQKLPGHCERHMPETLLSGISTPYIPNSPYCRRWTFHVRWTVIYLGLSE